MPTRSHLHRFPIDAARDLTIRCKACGHEQWHPQGRLSGLAHHGVYLGDIEPRLMCSKCGARGQVEMRVGNRSS